MFDVGAEKPALNLISPEQDFFSYSNSLARLPIII
jgi:hypothetical protein